MLRDHRRLAITLLGLVVATAALAAFPEDADTPTEGWKYGFRSIIDTTQYPNAQDTFLAVRAPVPSGCPGS